MKIVLTHEESEKYFHNALCNGLDYVSGYGIDVNYDDTAYKAARAKLDSPCFEDVLLQLLKDGSTLTIVDNEGGMDEVVITINDVYERVQNTPLDHLLNMINEEDDADTADVILQTVFYNEVVFG
jgi:hypothetical protein